MGGGRWRRDLVRAAAVVALINLGGWLVADGVSRWTLRRVAAEGWPVEGGALANVEALFPDNPENDAALALERVAAAAGIDVAPRGDGVPATRRPSAEAAGRFDAARASLDDYVKEETLAAPPAPLASFLDSAAGPLADAERLLESRGRPRWEQRASAGFEMPLPNLLGHVGLSKLLLARARAAGMRGERETAWRSAAASARLADSLESRPEEMSQLIRIAEARHVLAAMRVLPSPAPAWAAAWASTDLRPASFRASAVKAAVWRRWGTAVAPFPPDSDVSGVRGLPGRTLFAAFGPALRFMLADTLAAARAELRRYAAWSDDGPPPARPASAASPASWNAFGRKVDFAGAIRVVGERVAAEREEARRTLRVLSAAQESPRPDAGRGRPGQGEAAAR
ncbi:MAG: hypothetical protein ABFD84_04320 [Candidatus Polarisedimenticolia bacterium]|nr:hypothetical protein [bacterium]